MRRYLAVRGGAGDVAEPDLNAKPQDNLYLAVNSEWLSKAEIPADQTSAGVNTELDIKIEKRIMKDFADIASGKEKMPDIRDFDKAIALYKIAKNFDKRDAEIEAMKKVGTVRAVNAVTAAQPKVPSNLNINFGNTNYQGPEGSLSGIVSKGLSVLGNAVDLSNTEKNAALYKEWKAQAKNPNSRSEWQQYLKTHSTKK